MLVPQEEVIKHYGVLGMRWGHRKLGTTSSRSERRAAKKLTKGEARFQKNVTSKRQNTQVKLHIHNSILPVAQAKINKITAKPEYVKAAKDGKLNDMNQPVTKRYLKEVNKAYLDTANEYLSGYTSPSGKQRLVAYEQQGSFLNFNVRIEPAKTVKHADEPMDLEIEYVKDDLGRVIGFTIVPDSMAQSAIGEEVIGDILQHYGVLGMRWGHRRAGSLRKEVVHPEIADVPKKTRKLASKDAEEFTRAKLYFGEGAGTRRKLIKAKVETNKRRDPLYAKAFDHYVRQTDLGKRAVQARAQRKRTDTATFVKKTGKGVGHVLRGNNQYANTAAILGVAAGSYIYKKKGGDRIVADLLKRYAG